MSLWSDEKNEMCIYKFLSFDSFKKRILSYEYSFHFNNKAAKKNAFVWFLFYCVDTVDGKLKYKKKYVILIIRNVN